VSSPSYFDDPQEADKLRGEARSWIGTPFGECYQAEISPDVKGAGGGIDCVGLVSEIFYRAGATGKWRFKRSPADYQAHQSGEKVLDYFRGKILDDPQSQLLKDILIELDIPEAFFDGQSVSPRDFFKTGDILVLRHGNLFHLPVIYDEELHFVSALPRWGVTEGTLQDSSYSTHLVAAFRLKPR